MGPVIFSCAGVTYHLLLNGAALFDIYEEFGSKGFVLDHIKGNGKDSFRPTCWILAKLAEQGELLWRYQGYDKGPIPPVETFLLNLSPLEVPLAKDAIARAVQAGFRREEGPAKKEVDKGLLEIEKKTGAS